MSTQVSIAADGSAILRNTATGQVTRLSPDGVRVAMAAGDQAERSTQAAAEAQIAAERLEIASRSRSPVSQAQSAFARSDGVRFLDPASGFPVGLDQLTADTIVSGPGGQWAVSQLLATGEASVGQDGSIVIHDAVETG